MATNITQDSPKIDKNKPWYVEKIGSQLSPTAVEIFKDYSHIPEPEIENHIYAIRDHAWSQYPYPCIGEFNFLSISLSNHPLYATILTRLKTTPATFLDLGCCVGQDIRKLLHDGAPASQIYASDLRPAFWDLGKELFRDGERLDVEFIAADLFAPEEENALLKRLKGGVDVIHAASLLHLWGWDYQIEAGCRIIGLLKEGGMVVGRMRGNKRSGERKAAVAREGSTFLHNKESFERLWSVVGERVGRRVMTEVKEGQMWGSSGWREDESVSLIFTVRLDK